MLQQADFASWLINIQLWKEIRVHLVKSLIKTSWKKIKEWISISKVEV